MTLLWRKLTLKPKKTIFSEKRKYNPWYILKDIFIIFVVSENKIYVSAVRENWNKKQNKSGINNK